MKIHVAPQAGFCYGVKRALEIVQQVRRSEPDGVFTLGPLIHNPRVVEDLRQLGVAVAQSPEDAGPGVLVIRSHGATPDEVRRAQNAGLKVVDATCPCLKQAQKRAVELCDAGYALVLLGERDHAEVRATVGITEGRAVVVESAEDVVGLELPGRVALLSQTTQTFANFRSVALQLLDRVKELVAVNTICHATSERQDAAAELARRVEAMIVIGGRNSANTARLAEVCRDSGARTYHIESADELQQDWFKGVRDVGLTAGASTPQGQIEEVVRRMEEMDGKNVNGTHEAPNNESFEADYSGDFRRLEEGDVIQARVVHVLDDMAFVDVGTKSELGIPLSELTSSHARSARDVVSVGDVIDVLVVRSGDEDKILLSARKAQQEKNWVVVQEALDEGRPIEGIVQEVVKGGLVADVGPGIRAFIPASQMTRSFSQDLSGFVGGTYSFVILEVDRSRKRVVLSRKALLETEYDEAKKAIYGNLQVGDIKEGRVSRLADFGAFVDLGGGVEGLLHVSEIAWDRVARPSDRLEVGMPLRVEIIKVDPEKERISLSLRSLTPHPWAAVSDRFQVGAVVPGTVTRLAPFGAFVRVADGIEGLVHISHLSDQRVAKPEDVVMPGQKVQVKIVRVDAEARRLSLSIREAGEKDESDDYRKYMHSDTPETTIGDMLREKEKAAEQED